MFTISNVGLIYEATHNVLLGNLLIGSLTKNLGGAKSSHRLYHTQTTYQGVKLELT
jgi:hypothetical protein